MEALPVFRDAVVTVGSFDGVHRGHKHLLDIMREKAYVSGGETIVVTFDRHPRRVLDAQDEIMLLTTLEHKTLLLAEAGVDNLVVMPFDDKVAQMSPEKFVRDFLVGRLGMKELVVGYNHRFGKGRQGDSAMLRGLEEKYGFRVHEAPQYTGGEEKISSTMIREAIRRGDVEAAEKMLGRTL
jgi:riboflavin kinase/FMN adenylyltransferase